MGQAQVDFDLVIMVCAPLVYGGDPVFGYVFRSKLAGAHSDSPLLTASALTAMLDDADDADNFATTSLAYLGQWLVDQADNQPPAPEDPLPLTVRHVAARERLRAGCQQWRAL